MVRSSIRSRSAVAVVVLAVTLGSASGSEPPTTVPPATIGPPDVRYQDGRLSVDLHQIPLDDVMREVARVTGIDIVGTTLDTRLVSKRFDRVPLPEALRRLVGRQNFLLSYHANGEPAALQLLGMPQTPVPRRTRGRHRTTAALPDLAAQPPVPVPLLTGRALGGSALRWPQLLPGLHNSDPRVRIEVADLLIQTLESRADLAEAFRRLDARTLMSFVSAHAGAHASEIAERLASRAHDGLLRSRLNQVVVLLRRPGGR